MRVPSPKLQTLVIAAGLLGTIAAAAIAQTIPTDTQPTCTVTVPVFATWFEKGTATLNGVVKPADSVAFLNTANNCIFYQWSEQMYLWLTSPAPASYGGGGRIFDSPTFYDVSPLVNGKRTFIPHTPGLIRFFNVRAAQVGPHQLPVIMDRAGKMFEVAAPKLAPSGKPLLRNQLGKVVEVEQMKLENGKPIFLDKAGKPIPSLKPILEAPVGNVSLAQKFLVNGRPIFLSSSGAVIDVEPGQADGGVLEAQNHSLIYYTTIVNDVYAYFLTGVKDHVISPGTFFPTTQAELNQVTAFAASHGRVFPDPNALAIEVKAAWIETTGLPNVSSYITTKATVPTYNTANPNLWIPNGQKTVTLALVGIHVVGSAKGHPEMIWATFEHFGNAPNAAYSYNSTSGPKTVPQNTAGTWLFAASGTAGPFNKMHMQNPFGTGNIAAILPFSISPSDTMRMKPWGAASNASPNPLDPTAAASNTELLSINNSIRSLLPAADIRNNYFMTGSTWTIGGNAPSSNFGNPGNPGGNAVGTSQLSNTTMETYQQGPPTFIMSGSNCFFCHVTNTTNVSHVYPQLQPLF